MENILTSIGRNIDQSLMEGYFGKDFVYTTNSSTSSLTLDKLKASVQSWIDEKQAYTRQFWSDLALKYGTKPIFVVIHPNNIKSIEEQALLDSSIRPAWVRVSQHTPLVEDFYICQCSCLCHDPYLSMTRRMLPNGNWCCVCSQYEDI